MRLKQATFYVDERKLEEWKAMAAAMDVSFSTFAKMAISEYYLQQLRKSGYRVPKRKGKDKPPF